MARKLWTCPKCNTKTMVGVWPVRCACGYVDRGPKRRPRRDKVKRQPRMHAGAVPWVSTRDMTDGAIEIACQLPPNVSGVVGVARSGLIPASVMAAMLHVPLYSVDRHSGRILDVGGGDRVRYLDAVNGPRVLVDDSIHNGGTLGELLRKAPDLNACLKVAMIATSWSYDRVDYHWRVIDTPHLFQWNAVNCPYARHMATDMDGIICHNPPREHVPYLLPRLKIGSIITARTESQRTETETWLHHWRVRYHGLHMWPYSAEERTLDAVADWKANVFRSTGMDFYIESEPDLADAMRSRGVRVLCPQQGYLL